MGFDLQQIDFNKLSVGQRSKLFTLLAEMRNRGLSLPKEAQEFLRKSRSLYWPTNAHGYFNSLSGKEYAPTLSQEAFIKSDAWATAFVGGRGSGKSASGAQKALAKIKQGFSGAVLNPDFENLRVSTWPEFREWLPWEMVAPRHQFMKANTWTPHQPFTLAFMNGARVIIKGLKDEDSARGPNINWLWYDEAGRDKTGSSWQIAIASVRVGKFPQVWATFTPKGKAHWLYKFFVVKDIPKEAQEAFDATGQDRELIEIFEGSILDNKNNLDPSFMAAMLTTYPSGYLRDQEIYGRFVEQGGSLGNRSWFNNRVLPMLPEVQIKGRLRYWDLAGTEKKVGNDPDETVGTKMSMDDTNFYIEGQVGAYVAWSGLKELIRDVAIMDGFAVKQIVEQEPGSGGKNQVAELDAWIKREIPGHPGVIGYRPEGDRVMLANIWFSEASQGKIYIINGDWVNGFFDQLEEFPEGRHDDKITSVSGARINLAPMKKWRDIPFLSVKTTVG